MEVPEHVRQVGSQEVHPEESLILPEGQVVWHSLLKRM